MGFPGRVLFGSVGSKKGFLRNLYKGKPSKNLFHVWGANDSNWLPKAARKPSPNALGSGQAGAFNHNDLVVDEANPGRFVGKSENPLPVFGIVTTPCTGTANLAADLEV